MNVRKITRSLLNFKSLPGRGGLRDLIIKMINFNASFADFRRKMKCDLRRADGAGLRNLRAKKISLNGFVVQNSRMGLT
ncbi:MAG: hypothetical protein J7539_02330 [Niabella sp.]|nr:hypothetical protein [Niabella sp.]